MAALDPECDHHRQHALQLCGDIASSPRQAKSDPTSCNRHPDLDIDADTRPRHASAANPGTANPGAADSCSHRILSTFSGLTSRPTAL